MIINRLVLTLSVLVFSGVVVQADTSHQITMVLGVETYHLASKPEHNNDNQIIGLLYDRWFITRFKNSHTVESWGLGYALGDWQFKPLPDRSVTFETRFWAGVATGYGDRMYLHWGPLTLAFLPEVVAEVALSDRWTAGVSGLYIWTEAGGVWVSGLQLGYRF